MTTFHKVEGLANDFILLERRTVDEAALGRELAHLRERAPALCDRRRGVGADGILVVGPARTPGALASMHVINHDGSVPEMCGNGLRCVALWVAGPAEAGAAFILDTDAGPKPCELVGGGGSAGAVRVDMGPPVRSEPVHIEAVFGRAFQRVSMGNPHAIATCKPGEEPRILAECEGPLVEQDGAFPEGTNVEFIRVADDGALECWVFERGVGITMACGTGACAAAVAAVDQGLVPGPGVRVRLPGGQLDIVVPEDDSAGVWMTGPARVVFQGILP